MKKLINRFESPVEFVFLLLVFIVALCFFAGSFDFTGRAWIFPRFTSLATLVCVAVYAAKRLTGEAAAREEKKMSDADKADAVKARRDVTVTIVMFVGYLFATWLFGFLISSALVAVLYPLGMGYRNIRSVAACFATSIFFVLAFQKLMGISLSRGVLLDWTPYFF